MSSFILRLEQQHISDLYISLSLLLIWNLNDKYIHTLSWPLVVPSKTIPVFRPKLWKKPALWGGTYLVWLISDPDLLTSDPGNSDTPLSQTPSPACTKFGKPRPRKLRPPPSQIWKTQTPHSPKLKNSDLPISISRLNSLIHHLNNWPVPTLLAIKAMERLMPLSFFCLMIWCPFHFVVYKNPWHINTLTSNK